MVEVNKGVVLLTRRTGFYSDIKPPMRCAKTAMSIWRKKRPKRRVGLKNPQA
jgi:hypothetical protein